jgi:periplasmic divalent cation tolerance protein
MDPIEIEMTCPDAGTARAIARAAVEARLAACGWVIPGVEAVYRWQGAVDHAPEVLLRLKSRADLFDPLCALIRARHPYDLPAIVALPVVALGPGVADWWRAETGPPG